MILSGLFYAVNIYIYYSTLDRFREHGLIVRRDISYVNRSYIKCNTSIYIRGAY
jgi:hypothetical protein